MGFDEFNSLIDQSFQNNENIVWYGSSKYLSSNQLVSYIQKGC
jgi:hypothetical protein